MAVFNSNVVITDAQLVDAPQLEPAFGHMLRNSSVHESVISILRANAIVDRDTFVNMYDSESSLKEEAADLGFDLSTGGLPHKREFARIVTAWKTAKVMAETKLQTDAVAKAHGVPVTLLPCDWTSIMTEFKNKFGNHISDDRLPAQSMFESFTEKLADGTFKAESLSLVVSLFEEEQQDAKKPDHGRQYNLQLDSRLTISTKRGHQSTEPTDEKGLRLKYAILTNLWLLGQMRQPGRSIYQDFTRTTWNDFLDTLLDRDNFNFHKEVNGRTLISPCWSFCLSYEFELRKEAVRLCKEQAMGVQAALWTALRNPEHRMKHWLQLVAIPNALSSSSGSDLQALKKRISDLEKARSRSPRRNSQTQPALPGPAQLALPAPSGSSKGSKGGKGSKNQRRRGKGQGKMKNLKGFENLMKLPVEFRQNFHERFHKKEICYNFQKNACSHGNCRWAHICVGCGGSKPYDDCQCLSLAKSAEPQTSRYLRKPRRIVPRCLAPRFPLR